MNLQIGPDGGGDALAAWNTDYAATGPSGGGPSASLNSTGGTVTFGAGQTAVYLTVAALSDATTEGVEGFRVTVLPSANYQAGWSGAGSSGSGGGGGAGVTETTADVRITELPTLSIAANPDPIVTNQGTTFSVLSATGLVPEYTSVAWDFDYDGQTGTLVAGSPVTFSLVSGAGSVPTFASVAWDFDYDWATFHADATGTAPSAIQTFDAAGDDTDRIPRRERAVLHPLTGSPAPPTGARCLDPRGDPPGPLGRRSRGVRQFLV